MPVEKLEVRTGWVEFNCVQYRDATDEEILAQPCVQEALNAARAAALDEVLAALTTLLAVNGEEATAAEARGKPAEASAVDLAGVGIIQARNAVRKLKEGS